MPVSTVTAWRTRAAESIAKAAQPAKDAAARTRLNELFAEHRAREEFFAITGLEFPDMPRARKPL